MRRNSPDGVDMIIRIDQGRIITINHKDKTYSSITIQQMNEEIEKAAEEISEDKVQMETIREAMGKTMGSITVTRTGAGETIAGYRTEKYSVQGPMQLDIWAAPELKVPPLYYEALKMNIGANPLFNIKILFEEFKKIDGMTLKSVQSIKAGKTTITRTTVVTSIRKSPIPSSVFEVPAGYKEIPSDIFK